MPRTKSVAKSAHQSEKRRLRLQPYKTSMKTLMRKMTDAAKAGKKEEISKLLPQVYKAIDMAAKKNIIHRKNAAHKKSSMAKLASAK